MKGAMSEKICNIENSSQARSLAADATVSCGLCGAKSHDPVNVCDPVEFAESGARGKK